MSSLAQMVSKSVTRQVGQVSPGPSSGPPRHSSRSCSQAAVLMRRAAAEGRGATAGGSGWAEVWCEGGDGGGGQLRQDAHHDIPLFPAVHSRWWHRRLAWATRCQLWSAVWMQLPVA